MACISQLHPTLFNQKIHRPIRSPLDDDAIVSGRFESNPPCPSEIALAKMLGTGGWGFAAYLPAGAGESGKTD